MVVGWDEKEVYFGGDLMGRMSGRLGDWVDLGGL